MQPEAAVLLVGAAGSLVFAVVFGPARQPGILLLRGGVGLVAMALIAVAADLDTALLVVLALAVLQGAIELNRGLAVRLRAPVFAISLVALALVLDRASGPAVLHRFAAVGIAAGLAAIVGLLPFMHEFDPAEAVSASPIGWMAFAGPIVAAVLVLDSRRLFTPDTDAVFAAILIGLGLLNALWGSVSAWVTEDGTAAWRYAFMSDWGLVLCGFGLTVADGQSAALLMLLSIVVCRLPLYLMSRPALREKTTTDRPVNLVVAAVLSGSAPFVGFAARVLLFRGATELFWPLGLVLAVSMLLWLPGSLRLGRTLGQPRGRQLVGIAIVLAVNTALGLYPLPVLSLAGT